MNIEYEERTIKIAEYIVINSATVRETAKNFGLSKSCVHKDICMRLQRISPSLYNDVRAVFDKNKAERHLRGGYATKLKYQNLKMKE